MATPPLAPNQRADRENATLLMERIAHRLKNAASAALGGTASPEAVATLAAGLAHVLSGPAFTPDARAAFGLPDDRK